MRGQREISFTHRVVDDGYLSTHNTRLLCKSDIQAPFPDPHRSRLPPRVGQILISIGGKIDFNR